jgi:hypothetical protein
MTHIKYGNFLFNFIGILSIPIMFMLPFEVLAASFIDAKINASDGPVSVPNATIGYLSWTSAAVKSCTMDGKSIAATGSNVATIPITASHTYNFVCQKTSGSSGNVSDSVTVNPVADPTAFTTPTPITINGYTGSAMEPFISRDGQFLFFNDSANNKQIYYATRVDDVTFNFVGLVGGNVNIGGSTTQQTPSMDSSNNFYFTSNRSYNPFAGNFETVFGGTFNAATGAVSGVSTMTGISRRTIFWIDMDVGISPDGQNLYYAEAYIPPGSPIPTQTSMAVAAKTSSTTFSKLANSNTIMAKINNSDLNYAPDISPDGLELFFTRFSAGSAAMYRATRTSTTAAFSTLQLITAADGYVEGPSLTSDTKRLYYHKQTATNTFAIYTVTRP